MAKAGKSCKASVTFTPADTTLQTTYLSPSILRTSGFGPSGFVAFLCFFKMASLVRGLRAASPLFTVAQPLAFRASDRAC